jgi:hypothetical protein
MMALKSSREWAECTGLGGLYIDRTLEVLVDGVRADLCAEFAKRCRDKAAEAPPTRDDYERGITRGLNLAAVLADDLGRTK